MQVNISTKAVLASFGTVMLGVFGWFAVGHIELGSRVTALESSRAEDARRDEELREIRKTMQDMVVLFFAEHGPIHGMPEDPLAETDSQGVMAHEEELFVFEGEDADAEFNAVQMDLESALRREGRVPAMKAAPPKK